MVYYSIPNRVGLDSAISVGDGYTITLKWFKAYPRNKTNKVAYNIYYSTNKEDVYSEGPKFVSIDDSLEANIIDLTPGQNYWWSIRPMEYDEDLFDLSLLPSSHDNLRFYPYSMLRQGITSTQLNIPLLDVEGFPSTGVIKIGVELIQYLAVDSINNNLVLTNINQRGYNNTIPRSHATDGYDGYRVWSSDVLYTTGNEDTIFDNIYMCQSRFEYPYYQYTPSDGYHQVLKDILTTDLSASDALNEPFPSYDYSGWHRTDPVQLLTGECVGSYISGERGCIDAYGNYNIIRGSSLQDQNNQREEELLELTGRPAVLIRKSMTGITTASYLPSSEYPDDRDPYNHFSKFVLGYEQFFNPRRSDGRILVRVGPTDETLKMYEAGLESEFPCDMWTLTVPTIKQRDIIVLFDIDGNEEFRYEVLSVTRNNTLVGLQGGQKMRCARIRKTDPAYQIRIFRDTSMFPFKFNTTVNGSLPAVMLHSHQIVLSEKITNLNQINQTTAVMWSHNHSIVNGIVQEVLGHSHKIIL